MEAASIIYLIMQTKVTVLLKVEDKTMLDGATVAIKICVYCSLV